MANPGESSSGQPVTTPLSASGLPKLKLKFSTPRPSDASDAASASSPPPSETKALKSALKKAKKDRLPRLSTSGKKRNHATALGNDEVEDLPQESPAPLTNSSIKKIKLTTNKTPTTPLIRLRSKGKPPNRPLGVGYDSEASDREIDPAIEEEFILRMQPGDDCDYLRKVVEERRWGPKSQGGADVRLKFLRSDGRRAVLIIRGRIYAAILVDLPCVIEGLKSWDRRGWWKTADICQMLLVLGQVKQEFEADEYPLPGDKELDKTTWQWAHGITPPMKWVRKRRFRKRVSNRTIEAVEEEVERLLRLDEECVGESKYEIIDNDRASRGQSRPGDSDNGEEAEEDGGEEEDDEQDAQGEDDDQGDYFNQPEEDDGLGAELEAAMMQSDAEDATSAAATPADFAAAVHPETDSEVGTPGAFADTPGKDDSGDEESEEDDDAEEVDEDQLEKQAELQRQREEIEDLRAAIESQQAEYERQQNSILKKKIMGKIQSLKGDLDLKLAAIGEGGDD
jgi:transcription initiation factor TFIID subunit 7